MPAIVQVLIIIYYQIMWYPLKLFRGPFQYTKDDALAFARATLLVLLKRMKTKTTDSPSSISELYWRPVGDFF
jgi:hypothetical protein